MEQPSAEELLDIPIPIEEGVRLLAGDLERGRRFNKTVLLFAVYRAEATRARAERLLEARLRELGFRIERVRFPRPEEPDWPYYLYHHPPDRDTVFFVYDLRKGFPALLDYLNYRREIFVEKKVRAVFWVLEEEARELALKAPDFWAFRTHVLEFLEVPPPAKRVEIARDVAWWGFEERLSAEERRARIAMRERLLEELGEGEETAAARAELLYTLGGLYYWDRQYDRALEAVRNALALAERMDNRRLAAWCWNNLGNVYADLGRYDEAVEAYKKAVELDPDDAYPWNGLGEVYRHLGRYDEAIKAYQKAIELDANYAYPWNNLGNVHAALGRYDEAIKAYQKAIELDANYAYPSNNLGNIYAALGRYDEAIKAYRRAIELDADFAYPWNGLGNVYADLGRYEEAREAYWKALEIGSLSEHEQAVVWNGLGNVYDDLGRYDEAVEAYKKAVELDPDDAYPWNGLGNVYYQQGRYEEAIAAYKKAIELDPQRPVPYRSLAGIYRRLGDEEQMAHHLAEARRRLPPDDHYNRACLEAIAGNKEAALEHLRQALEKNPAMREWARRDPDMEWIREEPEFKKLVG